MLRFSAAFLVACQFKHLRVAPSHVAHPFGGSMGPDSNKRPNMERHAQDNRGQKAAQEMGIKSEIAKERKISVPRIVGTIVVFFYPFGNIAGTLFDGSHVSPIVLREYSATLGRYLRIQLESWRSISIYLAFSLGQENRSLSAKERSL